MSARSQTAIFTKLVRDFMRTAHLVCPTGMTVGDVVAAMAAQRASSALVVDVAGGIAGIFTEQDATRRVTFQTGPETPVDVVMTRPAATIGADDFLYHAIARMRRLGLHEALAAASIPIMAQID
jgi:CBS domain-containing protein